MRTLLAILIFCLSLTAQAQLTISPAGSSGGLASTDIDTTTEINALTTNDDFPTLTASNVFTKLALGTTTVSGLQFSNTTAAAAGAQQFSPAVQWTGQGWKTTATAASQPVDFRAYIVPIQGSTAPTGKLVFDTSINGGAFAAAMALNSTNTGSARLTVESILGSAMNADGSGAGNPSFNLFSGRLDLASTGAVNFSSNASATSTMDAGIRRNAPGVLEINSGSSTVYRDILARGLRSNAVTFANAITSPVEGTIQAFTDSSTAVWGETITGGGANHVLGYWNGTAWTVIAK